MTEITVPAGALVVLVGISGAGKSTFAAGHFPATAILSSDAFRAMIADDEADQGATRAAFELVHLAARRRLERGRLTVIDATSVTRAARLGLVSIARRTGRPAVAIVLDLSLAVCLERNAGRPGRRVDRAVVARQAEDLAAWLAAPEPFATEGFAAVHRITDPATVRIVIAAHPPGTLDRMPARRSTDRRTAR